MSHYGEYQLMSGLANKGLCVIRIIHGVKIFLSTSIVRICPPNRDLGAKHQGERFRINSANMVIHEN